ncbi:MAG: sugar ABC transporter substrate-binding protein [Lachnospiraceae bacterium]|nr:sugar ABC transporter substrate-binding protein [Lachnospiraceae bacterium]
MKKIIALLLAVVMVFSMAACNNSNGGENKKHKIGVANVHSGESWEIAKTYLEKVVAPAYNFEFIFSEVLSDANGLIAFMEQCYAAGCDGIINLVTSNDAIAQGARKAEEWGMWFAIENSAYVEEVSTLSHNLGHVGAGPEAVGEAYKKAFANYLSDGKPHSVILFEGAAVGGDKGQGAASHFYSAVGVLEAFQEAYNLTYDAPIADLVNNQNPGEVNTGNPDVHIYLYPGRNPADAVTALSPVLQSGTYDIFAAVFSFAAFTNAIDEVEKALGKDIKIIGTAQIEAQTKTGFTTTDSTGDSVLNSAILNDLPIALGTKCIMLKHAFEGRADAMKDNGKTVFMGVRSWAVNGADVYSKMEKLNTTPELYVLSKDKLEEFGKAGVTWKDLDKFLEQIADVDYVLGLKGLK